MFESTPTKDYMEPKIAPTSMTKQCVVDYNLVAYQTGFLVILQNWTIARLNILSLIATYFFSGYGEQKSSPHVVSRDADSSHSKIC